MPYIHLLHRLYIIFISKDIFWSNILYGCIVLPTACKINNVNMQLIHGNLRLDYISTRHKYIDMQIIYVTMQDIYVNVRLRL